jgi:hypothetical protein
VLLGKRTSEISFLFIQGAALLFLGGCSKLEDPLKKALDEGSPPAPVLESLAYDEGGTRVQNFLPISSFLSIAPDLNSGNCTDSANFTITGTYDVERTKSWLVTGLSSYDLQTSAGHFTLQTCLGTGGNYIFIKTVNSEGKSSSSALTFSIQVSLKVAGSTVATLGEGHPKYPSPGFRTMSASPKLKDFSSGSVNLKNFAIDNQIGATIVGSGGSTLTVGLVPILSEVNP